MKSSYFIPLFNPNKYYIPAFKATLTGGQALPWKTLCNFVQDPLEHFSGLFSGIHHSTWLDEETLRLSKQSWKLSTERKAGGPIWDPVPRIFESEIESKILQIVHSTNSNQCKPYAKVD